MESLSPPNFSWIEPSKVAGLALPRSAADLAFLVDNGIQHLVCLCEAQPQFYDSCPGLTHHHIPIQDFCPPSLDQIETFLAIVQDALRKDEGVAVHCEHGLGRTGTMLACYLVKMRRMFGDEAVREIRRLRKGSIETEDQRKVVLEYYRHQK
ncbi:hypothetical protein GJAV_G00254570 [Gymnothorax javanicus]|nr:hypothetical protein GJAV_G00254570 [Gymnothorax javanicus]